MLLYPKCPVKQRLVMGFLRFSKRIKIAPGVHLNLSKTGTSVSVGRPGATINFGGVKGTRATIGLPGTGVSYTTQLDQAHRGRGHYSKLGSVILVVSSLAILFWLLF